MSDIFGSLMKGLSTLMPQDDPKTQILKMQTEISDLKKQETNLYAEIGKAAIEQYGAESFGEPAQRLQQTKDTIIAVQQKLEEAQAAEAEREKAAKEALAARTCPNCGFENPEGTKFCQECGTKLGQPKQNTCPNCGAENAPGVKFCQECGTKLQIEPTLLCPSCGNKNPPGTRFCGECGTRLEG